MDQINFYSVIQCVPDPLAEERVNIGVLVISGESIEFKFLSNWKRAEAFARPTMLDITRSFRDELEYICLKAKHNGQLKLSTSSQSPADVVRAMVAEWSNQVQFTELRPSLENPAELLERLSDQFLVERTSEKREARNRNQIMFETARQFKSAIAEMDPSRSRHLEAKLHVTAPGAIVDTLQVDVGLLNGQLRCATESVSFQTLDIKEINLQWRESIYTLVDLKNRQSWVNTAIVVAAPIPTKRRGSQWMAEYDAARKSAESNGIAVVDEYLELQRWSDDQVREALLAS